ncbi:MAG: hypothetical protein QE487_17540 [Fluviicola sp.]|nr:hypothetical protein [Fluviicola sp.]
MKQLGLLSKKLPFPVICILLLIWPALYNGYPLFYADSGTYIMSSIHVEIPIDRPLFYGFFLRVTTMQAIMWMAIVLQGLISFWIINKTILLLYPTKTHLFRAVIFLLLAILSGLPWYTAQVMPDLFIALSILSIYLIYADRSARPRTQIAYHLILFFMIGTHYSNLPIAGLLISLFALVYAKKVWYNRQGYRWKTISLLSTLFLVGFTHSLITYTQFGMFRMSRGSNLFLIAKCLETPLLKTYMRENKNNVDIPFSGCIDSIPNSACGFLWGAESPLNQLGIKRVEVNEAYGPVISDIFSQSKYRNWFIRESFSSTRKQLLFHKVGSGLVSYDDGGGCYFALKKYYENELSQFLNAKQQRFGLENNYHNHISDWVFYLSFITIGLSVFVKSIRRNYGTLILLILLGVIANAFVTASLANVYDRLQVRVVWLLTFGAILIIAHAFQLVKLKKEKP